MLLQALLTEPILVGGAVVGTGGVLIWFAKLGIELKANVERLLLRVDDPQNGLVVTVQRNHKEVTGAMGELSNENVQIRERVRDVERTCVQMHGATP